MKKWHIITAISVVLVLIVLVIGSMLYKFFVLPRFIEPVVEDISDYLKDENVITALYNEAVELHDEGVMDDMTYTAFLRSYSEYFRNDREYAERILAEKKQNSNPINEETAIKTKYASNKVGIEIIKVNDGDGSGNADINYSDKRNSDRIKAEDYVKAEQIIKEEESTEEPTQTPDIVMSAYEKLKDRMTAVDFAEFTKIMAKLDVNTLKGYITDKEGLKGYLHSKLSDEEYKSIVNLGYKYVHVFFEEKE